MAKLANSGKRLIEAKSINKSRRGLFFLVLVGAVVAADQISKILVRSYMTPGESIPTDGPVRLTYATNKAGAFGLFGNQFFLLVLTSAIGLVILLLYVRYFHLESRLLKVGLGFELGGAVGNLIDRLRFGAVTDFIDLGFWPVFNLADSAITIGAILIAYYLLFTTKFTTKKKMERHSDTPEI